MQFQALLSKGRAEVGYRLLRHLVFMKKAAFPPLQVQVFRPFWKEGVGETLCDSSGYFLEGSQQVSLSRQEVLMEAR